ncbi:MAG TPA: response regulator, partial [Woeseiaceae bacterium]|nr:response regulator [Woeseiaceae bacterium]
MSNPDPGQTAIKVLIVDDEPLAQRFMRSLVDKEPGLETVGCCNDGAQARQEILRLEPDLVFLDVQMPKVSGVELMQGLSRTQQIPYVVFVTAFG